MRNTDCTTTCPGLKARCLAQNVRNQMSWFSISDTKQTRWSCFLTCFLLPTWPHSRHITPLLTWMLSCPISDSSPCYGVRGSRSRFMMSASRGIASMNECVNSGKCWSSSSLHWWEANSLYRHLRRQIWNRTTTRYVIVHNSKPVI